MALRSKYPLYVDAVTAPVGRGLARTGLSPNSLTTFGLVFTATATGLVVTGHPVLGGWVLVVGGLMDLFDGAVARATGRATPFGGFYDSVSDRISDGLILGGLAWWLRDEPRLFLLVVIALVAAHVTSYVRAKAEAIDLDCSVGILERGERAVAIMLALLLHRWLLEPVLWLLAVGGVITVIQRIHHVWCQIARDLPDEIIALTLYDHAWSRAFKRAARRFYGERNFDEASSQVRNGRAGDAGSAASADGAPDASGPEEASEPRPSGSSGRPGSSGGSGRSGATGARP